MKLNLFCCFSLEFPRWLKSNFANCMAYLYTNLIQSHRVVRLFCRGTRTRVGMMCHVVSIPNRIASLYESKWNTMRMCSLSHTSRYVTPGVDGQLTFKLFTSSLHCPIYSFHSLLFSYTAKVFAKTEELWPLTRPSSST